MNYLRGNHLGYKYDKDFFLLILAYAFVEIRAIEGSSSELPSKLADVLHHIPEALLLEMSEERSRRLYDQMMAKAEVHGLTKLIQAWEVTALKRLTRSKTP